MKDVAGDEGGAPLFQRRRGLAGTGPLPVPQGVDRVLHRLARQVGISFGLDCLCNDRTQNTRSPLGNPLVSAIQGRRDEHAQTLAAVVLDSRVGRRARPA